MSPIKRPHWIWQLWESDTTKCTATTQRQIPLLCPASSAVQLGCVLFLGRPLCFNNAILEPAVSHQLGMWPVQIQALILLGIHLVPSNIQQFHGHAQTYLRIWQYISDTWVSHSVSMLSDKWHNHKVMATPDFNNCSSLSDMFIINRCCHCTSRTWWLLQEVISEYPEIQWVDHQFNRRLISGFRWHCYWILPYHHCFPLIKCINSQFLASQTATSGAPTSPWGIPEPFNWPEHAISLTRNDADFGKQKNPLMASSSASMQDNSTSIIITFSSLTKFWQLNPHWVGDNIRPMGNVLDSMPAQTQKSSNIILGLSSVMRFISTSEPSRLLNLPAVLVSLTNSRTASLKHLVDSVWTLPCHRALPPGYSSKSMPALWTFKMQILSFSCQINLLPLLLPYKHLSMAQSHLASLSGSSRSRPIRTIRRWASFVILFATHLKLTQRYWIC